MKFFFLSLPFKISFYLSDLSRIKKIFLAINLDISICIFSLWFSFYLRLGEFLQLSNYKTLSLFSIILFIFIFNIMNIYKAIFRYSSYFILSIALFLYGLIFFVVITIINLPNIPRTIGIIHPLIFFFMILMIRYLIFIFLDYFDLSKSYMTSILKKNIVIYGAGTAGRQLSKILEKSKEFKVVGFIDDNVDLHNHTIQNIKIYSFDKLNKIIKNKSATHIFLAINSIDRSKRNIIIKKLSFFDIQVRTIPSIDQLANGKYSIEDIQDLDIDDLLHRSIVDPDLKLMENFIKNKTIMITGAGGSIGSELSRILITFKPKKIILFELSEYSLYSINEELQNLALSSGINPKIIFPILGSIKDLNRLRYVISKFIPDIIYHAAAYKHVPLLEKNIFEALNNNTFGTLNLVKVVNEYKIKNFLLVSSDKAVRPTNIMGASKRLAEMIVQINSKINPLLSKFTIVRFGNVLNSSGSVIPLFNKQIKLGGPITVTHPEITRYFMTIKEASELIIQSSAMSTGGEFFILDMGKPVKILDLAKKMIDLSGLSIKNQENLNGDIEIEYIGLRPGEKLYEELYLGDNPQFTSHKKINKINEPHINQIELDINLEKLSILINENNQQGIMKILNKIVPEYKGNNN